MVSIVLDEVATLENYHEEGYLMCNPDVRGYSRSPYQHLVHHGLAEGRRIRHSARIRALKAQKVERIKALIKPGKRYRMADSAGGPSLSFLDDALKSRYNVEDTDNVSGYGYDRNLMPLIEQYPDGLLLDCGAGRRPVYYENVVNYEIVNYDSTDVQGVAEELPFVDDAFDAVISVAVLEHVRDPWSAAREIVRVLKPGGKLFCCVPFLQPFHGYPNHYYNMTHVGLANLFRELKVESQAVFESTGPIHTLHWFLQTWIAGLAGQTKEDFLNMRVRDFTSDPYSYVQQPFVAELSETTNFTIASATILRAVKEEAAHKTGKSVWGDASHAWSRAIARCHALVRPRSVRP